MALVSKPLSIANVENGKSPFTHYAWAWNQLGTDRFTLDYPKENLLHNTKNPATLVGNNTANQGIYPFGLTFGYLRDIPAKVSDPVIIGFDWEVTGETVGGVFFPQFGNAPYNVPNRQAVTVSNTNRSGTSVFQTYVQTGWVASTAVAVSLGFRADNLQGTLKITNMRMLLSDKDTGYYPAPADDPTNASPLYQGVYTDNTTTASTNPQKYTWQRIKGENGANGQDAPTVTAVQVEYTQSLDGVTPPTSGWTSTKPTPNMGYWQWQRVRDVFSNGTYGAWVATSVYYGRDAIIISATEPTPKVDNMLWQKPNDPTVLRWNGSAWVEWGISVDNLVVDNATIENGVFKRIEGVEVIGSTIRNPYTREYLGGVRRDGEITLSEAEFKNSGKMYIDDVLKETYEQVISDRYIRMVRYKGNNFGDENNLIGSATLTFDTLTLVSKGEGVLDHGGSLTARQLTNTQWINLTYATGFRTSENNPCQYRLIYDLQDNPVVQFRGQVERTTGLMTGTTYPFTTLPPAIRTTKNVFKACTGDATELQTIRVGALKGDMGSVSNMIQVKAVGATQYVDISGLSYIVE